MSRKFYKDKYSMSFIEKLHINRGFKHVACDYCIDVFKKDNTLVIVNEYEEYYQLFELQMEV